MESQAELLEKIDQLDADPQIKAILKSLTDPEVQQRVRSLHNLLKEIEEQNKPGEEELKKTRGELAEKLSKKEVEYQQLKKKLEKLKNECCDMNSQICDLDLEIMRRFPRR